LELRLVACGKEEDLESITMQSTCSGVIFGKRVNYVPTAKIVGFNYAANGTHASQISTGGYI